ncbi:hypothetical protein J6590_017692, partial [Homalodisca vitripennis]
VKFAAVARRIVFEVVDNKALQTRFLAVVFLPVTGLPSDIEMAREAVTLLGRPEEEGEVVVSGFTQNAAVTRPSVVASIVDPVLSDLYTGGGQMADSSDVLTVYTASVDELVDDLTETKVLVNERFKLFLLILPTSRGREFYKENQLDRTSAVLWRLDDGKQCQEVKLVEFLLGLSFDCGQLGGEVRAKKPCLTLNLGTNGLKVASEPPPMAGTGSLSSNKSSSHARRCLIRLSQDNRCTRYTAPLATKCQTHSTPFGWVVC